MNQSKFMSVALQAAKEAEKVIMKYYSDEIRSKLKKDQSPVTLADVEAEKVIVKIIKENFPDHGFIGEELGNKNTDSKFKWVIDPIDGTKNYIRKIPLFATQIALINNNEIILGVSNAPALNELMYAEKGKGTFLNGKKVVVSSISNLSESYLCFGGLKYFEKHNYIDALLSLVKSTRGHRGIGDFWCYHLLAQGKIDIMIEPETKIWDIAAVKVIVEEAGGKVTDISGGEVTADSTSIIATNKSIHNAVHKFFS